MSDQYVYTTITTGTGTSPVYTVANPGYPYIFHDSTITTAGSRDNSLRVEGNAEINGDLKINGKSIMQSLEKIEERLAILNPNEELEKRWESLRDLRKAYMDLEAEIKEKEKVWKILKK
jgi:hypothetical protein